MKKFLFKHKFLIVAVLALITAMLPVAKVPEAQPHVVMDVLDPSLDDTGPAWEQEVGRRFSNAVVAVCHGGDVTFDGKHWLCQPWGGPGGLEPIEWLIDREQHLFPGRTLVILCCNPHHDVIHGHANVFYATGSVWCVPDRAAIDAPAPANRYTLDGRSTNDPDNVGNIFEFVEAR